MPFRIGLMIFASLFAASAMFVPDWTPSIERMAPLPNRSISLAGSEFDRSKPLRRRPIRLLLTEDEKKLLVANQSSGSLSVIDVESNEVRGEYKVASRLSDLIAWRDNLFLGLDPARSELLCWQLVDATPKLLWKTKTIGSPHCLLLGIDEAQKNRVWVGGLWSRQLSIVELPSDKQKPAEEIKRIDLPFAVGSIVALDQGSILASDRFGSRWTSFQSNDLKPIESGDLGSKRICSIALTTDLEKAEPKVIVVSQPLNRLAQAIRNDVHWGLMVANEILVKDVNTFLDSEWKESRRSNVPLGGPGEAKGDPEQIRYASNGDVAIPIGGMNEVAIGNIDQRAFSYVKTGVRPIDSCFSKNGEIVFVANHLDDSITVINTLDSEVAATIPLGELPELTSIDRGERLFHSGLLSHDGWMTCNSCHVAGHSNGFLNDNFSDQSFGAPKRVLSLLGHGDTAPFAWNGSAKTLEEQVRSSIEVTMQADFKPSDEQVSDIAEFVRHLPPPPSLAEARGQAEETDSIAAGRQLFNQLGCLSCHTAPAYTSAPLRDVGLPDELGKTEFNPPSLIGISQRETLLHDARFRDLRKMLIETGHQINQELTESELQSLLDFLNRL